MSRTIDGIPVTPELVERVREDVIKVRDNALVADIGAAWFLSLAIAMLADYRRIIEQERES